ncbi:MAG TPA: DUF169 domain-containing protein [Smithella sp.]|nr:DUF169 domain-containing protein [Smithella sp.]
MDSEFKETFLQNWAAYFPGAELPIGFYYSDSAESKFMAKQPKGHRCIIGDLVKVRKGETLCFNAGTIGCNGGKRYCGFGGELTPAFEYFLSYGIPGKLEGERYKKSPEMVKELMKCRTPLRAPQDYLIFKRWDRMEEEDKPLVIIFLAPPDVLSGLFTLANFDETRSIGVIAPFGAGCASIVDYPYQELNSSENRPVLGMFDVSARPFVPASTLSFAIPWPKFVSMVCNMKESFLITKSWDKIKARMRRDKE